MEVVKIKIKAKKSLNIELSEQMAEQTVESSDNKANNLLYALFVFLTTSLALIAMLFAADKIGFFAVSFSTVMAVLLITAFFTCTYMVWSFKWAIIILSHLFILIEIWQRWNYIFNGGIFLVRDMIKLVNEYYGTAFIYPQQQVFVDKPDYIFAIVLLLAALLSSLLTFLLSRGKGIVICGLMALGVFWACTNLSEKELYLPILISVLSVFMALVICNIGSVNSSVLAKKNKKAFVFLGDNKLFNSIVSVFLVVVVSFGAMFAFVPSEKRTYDAPLNEISKNPEAFLRKLSELDFLNVPWLSYFETGAGIGGGRLNVGSRPQGTGKTDLQVSISDSGRSYIYPYIKGYVGSVYNPEKRRWEDLPTSAYEKYADTFEAFENNGFTPQSSDKLYVGDDLNANPGVISAINIKNIDANTDYTYFPYRMLTDYFNSSNFVKEDFVRDTYIKGNRKNVKDGMIYEYKTLVNSTGMGKYLFDLKDGYSDVKLSKVFNYFSFMEENYLALPEEGLEELKRAGKELASDLFGPYLTPDEFYQGVRDYLNEHATYDLNAGATPEGKDFVEYFLYENQKGYCVHFATAATLLFRAMGIPARYVEGYIITNDDLKFSGTSWNDIPDSNAHAWVEVWETDGWKPIEVTPGFSGYSISGEEEDVSSEVTSSEVSSEVSSEISSEVSSEISSEVSSEIISSDISSEVSSNSSDELSTDGEETEGLTPKEMSIEAKMLIAVALMLVAAILIAMLLRCIAIARRNKRFADTNSNIAYRYVYDYILKLIQFKGLTQNVGETEVEFAQRADNELTALGGKFVAVTENALLAKFSKHEIEKEKLDDGINFSKEACDNIYESLSIIKRIGFMFVKHLR